MYHVYVLYENLLWGHVDYSTLYCFTMLFTVFRKLTDVRNLSNLKLTYLFRIYRLCDPEI